MIRLLITVTCIIFYHTTAAADVVVIVNPSNNNILDKTIINQIFLGKTKEFPDGTQVIAINQDEKNDIAAEFNRKILNKSTNQLRAYWSKLLFTGKGTPPKAVKNDADVIELITNNPNTIGYVSIEADIGRLKIIEKF